MLVPKKKKFPKILKPYGQKISFSLIFLSRIGEKKNQFFFFVHSGIIRMITNFY